MGVSMGGRRKGFTLVELVVVLSIIAILATLGILGFNQYRADGRDATRASRATALAEALEKYYDAHGEYPSCSQLTQSPDVVSSTVLIGVDKTALSVPGSTQNSITCTDLPSSSTGDYFAYVGDDSETCTGTSGNACVLFTLKYIEEGSSSVASIDSRRQTALSSTDAPTLSCTSVGVSQVDCSATEIPGGTKYEIQYSKSSTFPGVPFPNPSPTNTLNDGVFSSSSRNISLTGLDYSTLYYFRARALNATNPAAWSTSVTATTKSLAAPTVSRSFDATSITITWPAVQYATGYSIEYDASGAFSAGVSTATTTGTTHTITVPTGTTRYFRVKATFAAGSLSFAGPWSSTVSGIAVPPPTAPAASFSSSTTTNATFSWSALSYASNYGYRTSINGGAWSATQTTTGTSIAVAATDGAKVDIQLNTTNPGGTSGWSATVTGFIAPTVSCSPTTTSSACSWSANGASSYDYRVSTNDGAWSGITNQAGASAILSSGTQGTKFDIQVRSLNSLGQASGWGDQTTLLAVSAPSWNTWSQVESYPNWYTKVLRSDNGALCGTGLELYSQFNEGISPAWNGWGAFTNRGVGATETATYTSTVASYYATLQVQIQGYCRNPTTGAVSSTLATSVRTAVHTQPNITLSGATTCQGTYNPGGSGPGYAFAVVVKVTEVSYNLDANTSNVNWEIYRMAIKNGWNSYDQTKYWPWATNINGSGYSGTSNSSAWRTSSSVIGQQEAIASGTTTVGHDADGRKTIGFSGSDGPGSTVFGSASCSGSYTLADLKP